MVTYDPAQPTELLAYSEFCTYPDISVLRSDNWIRWLNVRFCVDLPITLMNTMFFNYNIYNLDHPETLKFVMSELFYREHRITYMITVKPPNYNSIDKLKLDYSLIENYGKSYYSTQYSLPTCNKYSSVIIVQRADVFPAITFRKALPEDNDDVLEMIDYEEPDLRIEHGDFYIAEVLMGTDESIEQDKIIVGEQVIEGSSDTTNIGLMWLTEEIDIPKLIQNYDLERMGNLLTFTPAAEHEVVQMTVNSTEQKAYYKLFTEIALDNLTARTILGGLMNDTSIASVTSSCKMRIISEEGKIKGEKKTYYEREFVFLKFRYIYEALRKRDHYLENRKRIIDVVFDTPKDRTNNESQNLKKASNAFLLKRFNLHPSKSVDCIYYFLNAMFSAYPEHDFGVVSISPCTTISNSLRKLLKYFTRVAHRPADDMPDEVFVTHRSSLCGDLSILPMTEDDEYHINKLIDRNISRQTVETLLSVAPEAAPHNDELIILKNKILDCILADYLQNPQTEFQILTIRCGKPVQPGEDTTIVGFIVLRSFRDYNSIRNQYILAPDEYHLAHARGEIVMLKLHPFFHMWSDEILRSVALKTGYLELYYLFPLKLLSLPNDLIINMMPVEPRRYKRNWFIDSQDSRYYKRHSAYVPFPKVNCVTDRLSVFHYNLLPTKFMGNTNTLVIVGFSNVCKAFLRLMVFSWNTTDLRFTKTNNCVPRLDITCIVMDGILEAEYDNEFQCRYCQDKTKCFIYNSNYSAFVRDATLRMDLRNWIHFVPGRLESIDRKSKVVTLENTCTIYYDKLLIMCDLTYSVTGKVAGGRIFPHNYAHINRQLDKIILYHKIQELRDNEMAKRILLIYGHDLAVFECIDFLLKHGNTAKDIVVVFPRFSEQSDYLNIPTIDKNLFDILVDQVKDLGIKTYESSQFVDWTLYQDEDFISKVTFKKLPRGPLFSVSCDLFINFTTVFLDHTLEKAFIKCGIEVNNGHILVDEDFRTNDEHIYAAGKFIQIRNDPNYQYKHTSARETAEKLMHALQLDQEKAFVERRYMRPCFFVALLPMDYMVTKITMPKRYLGGQLSNEFTEVMTTYEDGEFCRVRLNRKQVVEEIVCVTKANRTLFFLEPFCGKHESLLNNLKARWQMGWIKSFLKFFEEPWTELIMHERFEELQTKNRTALQSLLAKS
ncbi:cilia- and flagella-associated protein 61 isoform X2 [Scaptodrosophila lebanonensis]|nr:cilia- and flagella-associated protein 61 isoform X2 [Scaptodrosophila lebanonensis]